MRLRPRLQQTYWQAPERGPVLNDQSSHDMRKLKITNFSCIREASVELNRLTIIIGPQASGKSIISKLFYFFFDLGNLQRAAIEGGKDFDGFKSLLKNKFTELFPTSAWGDRQFTISFCIGPHEFKLSRTIYAGSLTDNIRVSTSRQVEVFYKLQADNYKKLAKERPVDEVQDDVDTSIEFREVLARSLRREHGADAVRTQFFIPAGRSFFTNMGRAIAAFEQARLLDPITVRFARLYTLYLDRYKSGRGFKNESMKTLFEKLLGGRLVTSEEGDYIVAEDGRKIPFSALSSGQQEMMPLFVTLLSLTPSAPSLRLRGGRLIYIEEPEAHLFPEAQSELVQILTALVSLKDMSTDLLLTTHSPYVLAKLNNLMLGGDLAKMTPAYQKAVSAIIPTESLLQSSNVAAYAIQDGRLGSIINDNGLIEAEYLDSISGKIAEEFDSLLSVEDGHQ
ncbi:AAA family ATPase [Burkholderia ambifaria]|uniref:AAA family ATPase n=1 Tax=Burkholderia ambifaria TaxID=152480 RepID=UPI00158BF18D|nr:AAA family ATPase [Burkholderia ambifaria]